jgi:hypothetical protein
MRSVFAFVRMMGNTVRLRGYGDIDQMRIGHNHHPQRDACQPPYMFLSNLPNHCLPCHFVATPVHKA